MSFAENSVWTVLRHRNFRALWAASLLSLLGAWMQNLGAAWLMTELDRSPVMVGAVQAAQMLPGIALGPLTGALADIFDRRRYLMAVMGWQTAVTLILAVLTFTHVITPWLLIACIFAVGTGSACQQPAMSANLQEIVPREEVVSAVTLNSLAINITRAVGPAIGGLLVGLIGEGAAFLVNSATYSAYLVAVAKNVPPTTMSWSGRSQGLWESVAGGLRYARRAKRFQAVLIRAFTYFPCAGAAVSLLPVMARRELKVEAQGFGILLGFIGLGAIITGLGLMGRLNARFSRDQIMLASSLVAAATLLSLAWVRIYWLIALTLVVFGGAWMAATISQQISAQMVLPAWVRGRGLSLNMMSMYGGMAIGSLTWGTIADHYSMSITYTVACIALLLVTVLTYRFKVSGSEPEEV